MVHAMKIIKVNSCSSCPYKTEHWSGRNSYGDRVYEGTSCAGPIPKGVYIWSNEINECTDHVHSKCPLEET